MPDRISPHVNNGYADNRTITRTRTVATNASGVAAFGPGKGRIQVVLGMNTATSTKIWGYSIGNSGGLTGCLAQQITSGQVVLNRALIGDSIDDEITLYDVSTQTSGITMVMIETTLID